MLRKWLSFAVMLVFVVSTMPTLSYASVASDMDGHKVVKAEPAKKSHHCHEKAEKTAPATADPDEASCSGRESCCAGAACKCPGNACNGAAKVLGGVTGLDFLPVAAKEVFLVSQDKIASSLSGRIKRPPRS